MTIDSLSRSDQLALLRDLNKAQVSRNEIRNYIQSLKSQPLESPALTQLRAKERTVTGSFSGKRWKGTLLKILAIYLFLWTGFSVSGCLGILAMLAKGSLREAVSNSAASNVIMQKPGLLIAAAIAIAVVSALSGFVVLRIGIKASRAYNAAWSEYQSRYIVPIQKQIEEELDRLRQESSQQLGQLSQQCKLYDDYLNDLYNRYNIHSRLKSAGATEYIYNILCSSVQYTYRDAFNQYVNYTIEQERIREIRIAAERRAEAMENLIESNERAAEQRHRDALSAQRDREFSQKLDAERNETLRRVRDSIERQEIDRW